MALTEVQILESELAAAREREAKNKKPTTLAEKLSDAMSTLNRLEHDKNLNFQIVTEKDEAFESANNVLTSGILTSGDIRVVVAKAKAESVSCHEKLATIEDQLNTAKRSFAGLHAEVNANPAYAAAIKKHKELGAKAIKLSDEMWEALRKAQSLSRELLEIPAEEQRLIGECNGQLQAEGLPKLNASFSGATSYVPQFLFGLDATSAELRRAQRIVRGES